MLALHMATPSSIIGTTYMVLLALPLTSPKHRAKSSDEPKHQKNNNNNSSSRKNITKFRVLFFKKKSSKNLVYFIFI